MRIDPIERTNLTISASAVAASLLLASPLFAISLALGALLEAVNFHGLRRQTQFLFAGQIQSGNAWRGVFALRFVLLVVGIGGGLAFGADPVGLVIGLSLIMPATVIEAWRLRPPADPNARALDPDDPAWERWNPWLARESEPREDDED